MIALNMFIFLREMICIYIRLLILLIYEHCKSAYSAYLWALWAYTELYIFKV